MEVKYEQLKITSIINKYKCSVCISKTDYHFFQNTPILFWFNNIRFFDLLVIKSRTIISVNFLLMRNNKQTQKRTMVKE